MPHRAYDRRLLEAIREGKISKSAPTNSSAAESREALSAGLKRRTPTLKSVLKRSSNRRRKRNAAKSQSPYRFRVHQWLLVVYLHRNSQPHSSSRGYQTPDEAAREAMVLNSIMKISKGSADRRRRWLEGVKPPGPIVETQPTAEGVEIVGDTAEIVTATQPADDRALTI